MKWNVTTHTVTRLKERFEVDPKSAQNFINQILSNSTFVNTQPDGKDVYFNEKRDMFIVVNKKEGMVITVHRAEEKGTPKLTVTELVNAVKKEFNKIASQSRKDIRKLSEQHAEISLEIARLTLNKVKCDAPHTKEIIAEKISELEAKAKLISNDLKNKENKIKTAEAQLRSII